MHVFNVAVYASFAYYALFVDTTLIYTFLAVIAIYFLLSIFVKGNGLSTRRKLMLATWTDPSQGNIVNRVTVRTQNVNKLIQSLPKENKLTLTHFAIKAVGQLYAALPDLNGKLVFGKFVPYESVDVSCLVDIQGGKDLAIITLRGVDKMSVQDIASFIKEKGSKIKKNAGGQEHKKRTKPFSFVPAFIATIFVQVVNFMANKLGLSIKPLGIQKHQFGAACITSLGMLGMQDAIAPFSGFTNCSMFLSINKSIKVPVVQNDKIIIGQSMNCNFVVDHRYVDGGKTVGLIPIFRKVFQQPQLYMDCTMKSKK